MIFYFSGQTSSELQFAFPFIKDFNPGHIAAYFILALLIFYSLSRSGVKKPFIVTFIISVLYGLSDELHQAFVPTRQPDIADLLRDTFGTATALSVIHLKQNIAAKKSKKE